MDNDLIWANRILSNDYPWLREFARKIVREHIEWWEMNKNE